MNPSTVPDLHSEDSVFRKLFSEESKAVRAPTKAERMARIFGDVPADEPLIEVSDFLPSY